MNICISTPKPENSIYAYCDNNFKGFMETVLCKLDTCRVCCVTSDQMTRKKDSNQNLESCFQKCAEKFVVDPEKEIN